MQKFRGGGTDGTVTNGNIEATGLTSGDWSGTFEFSIDLKQAEVIGEDITLTRNNLSTYGIAKLGDVVIPEYVVDSDGTKHKVTSIGDETFSLCRDLASVKIPNTVKSIGDNAFKMCSKLTHLEIPEGVTSIGDNTFEMCSSLINIEIPEGVTSIGENAFSNCTSLANIEIPEGVTSIRDNAFGISIRDNAFGMCSSLTSVILPSSLSNIGEDIFSFCTKITSIKINPNNPIYDSRNNCNAIIKTETNELIVGCCNTVIPNNVTSIGDWAFTCRETLTNTTIPDSVINIGDFAFQNCSDLVSVTYKETQYTSKSALTTVLTNNGVTVGEYAFDGTGLVD